MFNSFNSVSSGADTGALRTRVTQLRRYDLRTLRFQGPSLGHLFLGGQIYEESIRQGRIKQSVKLLELLKKFFRLHFFLPFILIMVTEIGLQKKDLLKLLFGLKLPKYVSCIRVFNWKRIKIR